MAEIARMTLLIPPELAAPIEAEGELDDGRCFYFRQHTRGFRITLADHVDVAAIGEGPTLALVHVPPTSSGHWRPLVDEQDVRAIVRYMIHVVDATEGQ